MHIRPLDLASDDDIAGYHAVADAASSHGRPYATGFPLAELRAAFRAPSTTLRRIPLVAEEAGQVLGTTEIELRLTDNLHLAEVAVAVHPDRRRRGVGTALVARTRTELEAAGRKSIACWLPGRQLWAGAPDDQPGGEAFARRCGLTLRNSNRHRVLELPVPDTELDRLTVEAERHHTGYQVVTFLGPCPDEHVDAYCRLKAAMVAEAPMGDMDMEPEVWDETRLREEEGELEAMGRTRLSALALAPDGEVAGFNELLHAAHDVGNAYNWDTLVAPAHRGHRLGMALKLANLRRFQVTFPDVRRVHTHNAAQNAPMVAVNDAVGFVAVEEVGEWQGDVADLPGAER